MAVAFEGTGASGAGRGGRARGETVVEGERGRRCAWWGWGGLGDGEDAGGWGCGTVIYGDEGADEEDEERGDEQGCVAGENGELVGEQAEVGG